MSTASASQSLTRNRDFMRLWIAQGVSALGSRFTRTALPIVAISGLAASPSEISILSALGFIPSIAVGLLAGGWIDRQAKRPLLIAMDILRAILIIAIPIAWMLGLLNIWLLYGVAFLSGAASTIFHTADNAYLPALLAKDQLVDGNTKLQTTDSAAEIAGPAMAGAVIQAWGWPIALMTDAISYVWSAFWLLRIPPSEIIVPTQRAETHHVFADIITGFALCWRHACVRPLLLVQVFQTFGGGFFMALYMVFTLLELKLGEAIVGAIIGVGGIGALLGVALVGPARRALGYGPAIIVALAIGQAALFLLPLSASLGALQIPALIGHQLISDGALTVYFVLSGSLRQSVLPQDALARAQSAFSVIEGLSLVSGALIAGALAEYIGVHQTVWIGVVCGAVAILPALTPALLRFQMQPTIDPKPEGV